NILDSQAENTLIIHGNHDMDLETTVMKELNLHLKSKTINGFKIAGYGGAAGQDGMPLFSGIPSELTTPFNEHPITRMNEHGIMETTHKSEPREFLEQEQPDIALLHTPLYGIMDKPHKLDDVEDMPEVAKHFGSHGMMEYAKAGKTRLFLFGHVHDRPGVVRIPSEDERMVVAINPGSLGKTETEGGNFAEVELDDTTKEFQSATFYRIVSPEDIQPTALYRRRNKAVIDAIEITSSMPQEGRLLTTEEMVENAVNGLRGKGGIIY
ncbi:MAG: metallophosphoesterase, partial [Nanoarchaeota archaeon]|nr:metallophosphoesterase [Nanoarchaeota archaeon]